jgi:hypothetical protein
MPNGGFGCAYCRFYTPGKCNLRNARITSDHWTVCANVTYLDNGPTSVKQYLGYRSLDTTSVEIKGSIFAITSDEGAYQDIPWLENQEIRSVDVVRECSVCGTDAKRPKSINWKDQTYTFCSYNHYFEWRDLQIQSGLAIDEITNTGLRTQASDFTELRLISENGSPEQREKSLRLNFWQRFFHRGRQLLFAFFVIALLVVFVNLVF